MDRQRAQRDLNRHLESLAGRRRRALADVDALSVEIGATATFLRDELGQSKAESARLAGISPSHMTEWMKAAVDQGVGLDHDPFQRIPLLEGTELQDFVREHHGPRRIVASFADHDLLYMSQVDPDQLLRDGFVYQPHMMIETNDDAWVAVDQVNVGYGGTGPGNAERELRGIGVDEDLAHRIAYHRRSDVEVDQPDLAEHTNDWPLYPLITPRPVGSWFVVPVAHSAEDVGDPRRRSLEQGPRTALRDWLDYLDRPQEKLPRWVRGGRRVRVYLDREAARAAGFTEATLRPWRPTHGTYPLIIEQGRLQLWVEIPISTDPTVLFTNEIHDALELAGFYTDEQRTRDNHGAFRRWLRSLGTSRPPYVDLKPDWPILHVPRSP
jgi:hypothetical protein